MKNTSNKISCKFLIRTILNQPEYMYKRKKESRFIRQQPPDTFFFFGTA